MEAVVTIPMMEKYFKHQVFPECSDLPSLHAKIAGLLKKGNIKFLAEDEAGREKAYAEYFRKFMTPAQKQQYSDLSNGITPPTPKVNVAPPPPPPIPVVRKHVAPEPLKGEQPVMASCDPYACEQKEQESEEDDDDNETVPVTRQRVLHMAAAPSHRLYKRHWKVRKPLRIDTNVRTGDKPVNVHMRQLIAQEHPVHKHAAVAARKQQQHHHQVAKSVVIKKPVEASTKTRRTTPLLMIPSEASSDEIPRGRTTALVMIPSKADKPVHHLPEITLEPGKSALILIPAKLPANPEVAAPIETPKTGGKATIQTRPYFYIDLVKRDTMASKHALSSSSGSKKKEHSASSAASSEPAVTHAHTDAPSALELERQKVLNRRAEELTKTGGNGALSVFDAALLLGPQSGDVIDLGMSQHCKSRGD